MRDEEWANIRDTDGIPVFSVFADNALEPVRIDVYELLHQVKVALGRLPLSDRDRRNFWEHLLMADAFAAAGREFMITSAAPDRSPIPSTSQARSGEA